MSFETVTSALHPYKLRMLGRDRARAICPVCGERNPNTLSVGVTTEGAVLLKCFKLECNIESICATLGLEVSDLFPPRGSQASRLQPRRLLTPAQVTCHRDVTAPAGPGLRQVSSDRKVVCPARRRDLRR